jgi:hypothetical protein
MTIVHRIRRPLLALAALVPLLQASPARAQDAAADPATAFRALEGALADAMHPKDEGRLDALRAPGYGLRGSPDIDRSTGTRPSAASTARTGAFPPRPARFVTAGPSPAAPHSSSTPG